MQELKCLLNKKYPLQVIDYGVKRAMPLDKNDLGKVKPKTTENIIPSVSTHNPKDPKMFNVIRDQRTIGPENAHLKPDLGVLSHHEMTLTLNTHTPLLTSQVV